MKLKKSQGKKSKLKAFHETKKWKSFGLCVSAFTGWLVSLMVDTVIIWDNKSNNNSILTGLTQRH